MSVQDMKGVKTTAAEKISICSVFCKCCSIFLLMLHNHCVNALAKKSRGASLPQIKRIKFHAIQVVAVVGFTWMRNRLGVTSLYWRYRRVFRRTIPANYFSQGFTGSQWFTCIVAHKKASRAGSSDQTAGPGPIFTGRVCHCVFSSRLHQIRSGSEAKAEKTRGCLERMEGTSQVETEESSEQSALGWLTACLRKPFMPALCHPWNGLHEGHKVQ